MVRSKMMSTEKLTDFCQQVYQLVRVGIPISECFMILQKEERERDLRALQQKIYELLESGLSLSQALAQTHVFPNYFIEMVTLGEQTGRLEHTLSAVQAQYTRQQKMKYQVQQAMVVPIILFLAMVTVIYVLITQVLPIFERVFAQLGVQMSWIARQLMEIGQKIDQKSNELLLGLVVVVIVVILCFAISPIRTKIFSVLKKYFGSYGIFGRLSRARFTSALAMATASGFLIDEALEIAGKLCQGIPKIEQKQKECSNQIREGQSTIQVLAQSGLFSFRHARMIQLAERTGNLSELLDMIAQQQQEETVEKMERVIGAIEPIMVITTAIAAGVILLSVMLPLMSILATVH